MTTRALCKAIGQLQGALNQAQDATRKGLYQQVRKIEDLTNNEAWWTKALAGTTTVMGIAILGSALGESMVEQDWIKQTLATARHGYQSLGAIPPALCDTTQMKQAKALLSRVDIPTSQAVKSGLDSLSTRLMDAARAILNAQPRN